MSYCSKGMKSFSVYQDAHSCARSCLKDIRWLRVMATGTNAEAFRHHQRYFCADFPQPVKNLISYSKQHLFTWRYFIIFYQWSYALWSMVKCHRPLPLQLFNSSTIGSHVYYFLINLAKMTTMDWMKWFYEYWCSCFILEFRAYCFRIWIRNF